MTNLGTPPYLPALSREVDSTVALLTHSCELLQTFRHPSTDLDPLFACLAPGVERLLKTVHGLAVHDATGSWPTQHEMSRVLGHDLVELNRRCQDHVRRGLQRATHTPYIHGHLEAVESDETFALLLGALGQYASRGRFHNLDTLADGQLSHPGPQELWSSLEDVLLRRRPDLRDGIGEEGGWEAVLAYQGSEVLAAVATWWDLYVRAAMHGCLGPHARTWLSSALPPAHIRGAGRP